MPDSESEFPDVARACRKLDDHEKRLVRLESANRIDSLSKFIKNLFESLSEFIRNVPGEAGAVITLLVLLVIPGLILIFYLGHIGIIHAQ